VDYTAITYEVIGNVCRVYHNRPKQANAQSAKLLAELDDALDRAKHDKDVRVLIIGGHGKHFSSGHDLHDGMEVREGFAIEDHWMWEEEHYVGNALRIYDFPKPTIAQVQGACIAGGFMVANMCDLVVAADDAYFNDPVVHSLAAPGVEVLMHPWVMGMRRAKKFLFTGQRISAVQAEQWGMVNDVVPRAELEQYTLELANHIASAPPVAMRMMKKSLNRSADNMGFRNSIMAHFDTHTLSHATREQQQLVDGGMEASMAKAKKMQG